MEIVCATISNTCSISPKHSRLCLGPRKVASCRLACCCCGLWRRHRHHEDITVFCLLFCTVPNNNHFLRVRVCIPSGAFRKKVLTSVLPNDSSTRPPVLNPFRMYSRLLLWALTSTLCKAFTLAPKPAVWKLSTRRLATDNEAVRNSATILRFPCSCALIAKNSYCKEIMLNHASLCKYSILVE